MCRASRRCCPPLLDAGGRSCTSRERMVLATCASSSRSRMRLFLALNLSERLRREIWEATTELRGNGPGIKWVAEERLHITLKFIGEQPESAVQPLVDAMRRVGAGHLAPHISVGGIGAFPTFHRPRVIWIGVEPDPRLELLHHDVEIACEKLGYEVEGRPFRPHLTLGRAGEP